MTETNPSSGPNPADAPDASPEGAQSFQYDVSKQARKRASEIANKPNPASPLAAG